MFSAGRLYAACCSFDFRHGFDLTEGLGFVERMSSEFYAICRIMGYGTFVLGWQRLRTVVSGFLCITSGIRRDERETGYRFEWRYNWVGAASN